jgi:ketosteroid isomerase-like protein
MFPGVPAARPRHPGAVDLTAAGRTAPEEAVRAAYEALHRGDLLSFTAHLDDQIEWHHPRGFGAPFGGSHRGPVAVLQNVVHGAHQAWAQVEYLPARFLAGPGHVVVLGTSRYHGHAGTVGEAAFGHVWLLRNGRADEVHIFDDTAVALRHGRTGGGSG